MSTSKPPNWNEGTIGQRIDDAIELIQRELHHTIAYVNDAVIPQVRRESIQGLRSAAETLRKLTDRFEQQSCTTAAPGSEPANAGPPNPTGEPRR